MGTYCFLNLLLCGSVLCWVNDSNHPETRLRKDLLPSDYHRFNRPVRDRTTVIFVKYFAGLYQLVGFNSQEQSIQLLIFQNITWHDEFLKWNPANYSGIEKIRIRQYSVWMPDVLLYTEIGNLDYFKFYYIAPLLVNYGGNVSWSQPMNIETTCSMDVTNFPFDSQTCEIAMGSWQYTTAEMRMSCDNELNLDAYIPDSLWDLKGISENFF